MVTSLTFTTKGRVKSQNIDAFLIPTLLTDTNLFVWVDLEDPDARETRIFLQEVFHFHPLSIEDCITESQSPKVEEYLPKEEDMFSPYLFLVIHAVDYSREDGVFATTELNIFLGKNFLVTYHRQPLKNLKNTADGCLKSRLPSARGPGKLACTLLEGIVANYKPALDELSLEIAELEDLVLQNTSKDALNKIIQTKKEVSHLRQIVAPQREMLAMFARGQFMLIKANLVPYYRNVYDGLNNISDLAQNYMDSLTGILQVYLNLSSNQTGEVVKLLTMITIITTPAMLISGWYGMNFPKMPEMSWSPGYLVITLIMGISTMFTYVFFKRKGWL